MGKFLRDKDGNLVAIDGGLVLEKCLDRKPRDCENCGFSKWVKKDKIFIIQRNNSNNNENNNDATRHNTNFVGGGAGMEWICPDCAVERGLPLEHYHKNFYATGNREALLYLEQQGRKGRGKNGNPNASNCEAGWNLLDITGFMCSG